jgi:hypothetical protein
MLEQRLQKQRDAKGRADDVVESTEKARAIRRRLPRRMRERNAR